MFGSSKTEGDQNDSLTKTSYALNTIDLAHSSAQLAESMTIVVSKLQKDNLAAYLASSIAWKTNSGSIRCASKQGVTLGRVYAGKLGYSLNNTFFKPTTGKIIGQTAKRFDQIFLAKDIIQPFMKLPKIFSSQNVDAMIRESSVAIQESSIAMMNFAIDSAKWEGIGSVFVASPAAGLALITLDYLTDTKVKDGLRPVLQKVAQGIIYLCELEAKAEAPLSPTLSYDGFPLHDVKRKLEKNTSPISNPLGDNSQKNVIPFSKENAVPVPISSSQNISLSTSKTISSSQTSKGNSSVTATMPADIFPFKTKVLFENTAVVYSDALIKPWIFKPSITLKSTEEIFDRYLQNINQLSPEKPLRVSNEIVPILHQRSDNWTFGVIGVTATGAPIFGITASISLSSTGVVATAGALAAAALIGYSGYELSKGFKRWFDPDKNVQHHLINWKKLGYNWDRIQVINNTEKGIEKYKKSLLDASGQDMDFHDSHRAANQTAKENDPEFLTTGIVRREKYIEQWREKIDSAIAKNNLLEAKNLANEFKESYPYTPEVYHVLATIDAKNGDIQAFDSSLNDMAYLLKKRGIRDLSENDLDRMKISMLGENNAVEMRRRLDLHLQTNPKSDEMRKYRIFLNVKEGIPQNSVDDIKFLIVQKSQLESQEELYYFSLLFQHDMKDSVTKNYLDQLVEKHSNNVELKKLRVHLYQNSGLVPSDKDILSILNSNNPLSWEDKLSYVTMLPSNEQGNAKACHLMKEYLRDNPQSLQGNLMMIQFLHRTNQMEEMKTYATTALKIAESTNDLSTAANMQAILLPMELDETLRDKKAEDYLNTVEKLKKIDPNAAKEHADRELAISSELNAKGAREVTQGIGGVLYYGALFALSLQVRSENTDHSKASKCPLTPQTEEQIRHKAEVDKEFGYKKPKFRHS